MPVEEKDVPQAFVRFARKISPKQYETAEASVSIPVAMENPDGTPRTISQIESKVQTAMNTAQGQVLASLDQQEELSALGARVVNQHFPEDDDTPAPEPKPKPKAAGGSKPFPTECPDCGGPVRDYRERKAAGEIKRTYPDWKCQDRDCNKAGWLTPKGS